MVEVKAEVDGDMEGRWGKRGSWGWVLEGRGMEEG
jgi:hypothetical protein